MFYCQKYSCSATWYGNNIHKKWNLPKRKRKRAAWFQWLAKYWKDWGLYLLKVAKDANLYAKIDASNIAELIKSLYSVDVEEHFFKMKRKLLLYEIM